jgi:hypothetical protein
VIVGSWQSPIAGNDVAVWLLDGSRWTRRDSAGTPLASTTTSLVQAAAAEGGTRLMVAGQAIELSPLRTRAMNCRAPPPPRARERSRRWQTAGWSPDAPTTN